MNTQCKQILGTSQVLTVKYNWKLEQWAYDIYSSLSLQMIHVLYIFIRYDERIFLNCNLKTEPIAQTRSHAKLITEQPICTERLTFPVAFLYRVMACCMRSLTNISPRPQGTMTLVEPKHTVTFIGPQSHHRQMNPNDTLGRTNRHRRHRFVGALPRDTNSRFVHTLYETNRPLIQHFRRIHEFVTSNITVIFVANRFGR